MVGFPEIRNGILCPTESTLIINGLADKYRFKMAESVPRVIGDCFFSGKRLDIFRANKPLDTDKGICETEFMKENTMTTKTTKYTTPQTLVERIEEVLVRERGMNGGSAITQAFAYCIFGSHSSALVAHDTFQTLSKAITPKMVSEAAAVIIYVAKPHFNGTVVLTERWN